MSHRDDVLAALVTAGPEPVSGQALAEKLGISRVAVGKHVAALKALGYEIEAAAGAGYRLTARPDAALPGEVGPLLETTMWTDFEWVAETDSTNDDLKAAARGGAPEGSVLVAGVTDVDGKVIPSLRERRGAPIWKPIRETARAD